MVSPKIGKIPRPRRDGPSDITIYETGDTSVLKVASDGRRAACPFTEEPTLLARKMKGGSGPLPPPTKSGPETCPPL